MFDFVCGMELETQTDHQAIYSGASYFFCTPGCAAEFKNDPDKFLKGQPIIHLEQVWKIFKLGAVEVPVLRGLSMRVHQGDLVALVGPSGSGKSTAMNVIGTLDLATSGNVYVAGKAVSKMTENELADLRSSKIGFIFQQFNLISSLSALENVLLPQILRGKGGDLSKKATKLLADVGLAARAKHKPMELSGGEQQRVAIARALMNDPEIILADEPTGNLDSETSRKVIDLLVELWKNYQKTIIIVTHDPHVASHAQRILSFKDGRLTSNHGLTERMIWKEKAHH